MTLNSDSNNIRWPGLKSPHEAGLTRFRKTHSIKCCFDFIKEVLLYLFLDRTLLPIEIKIIVMNQSPLKKVLGNWSCLLLSVRIRKPTLNETQNCTSHKRKIFCQKAVKNDFPQEEEGNMKVMIYIGHFQYLSCLWFIPATKTYIFTCLLFPSWRNLLFNSLTTAQFWSSKKYKKSRKKSIFLNVISCFKYYILKRATIDLKNYYFVYITVFCV